MADTKQPATSPLVVVVGPTASGKSAVAMELACAFDGEILCADSRTVYRGMDIGTAKPSKENRAEVPHHLLDVVDPDQTFTAADFKERALRAIKDISGRGKLPIMVGGTGLYIDGVIFDYAFLPPAPQEERERLEQMGIAELQEMIVKLGLGLPENSKNKRHLIRRIETNGQVPVRKGLRANTLVIGLDIEKQTLIKRINARIDSMFKEGLGQEVERLVATYGWHAPGMTGLGYREWRPYFEGRATSQEVAQAIATGTWQYARRQRTWFKRNPYIKWIKNSAEALESVKYFLQQ